MATVLSLGVTTRGHVDFNGALDAGNRSRIYVLHPPGFLKDLKPDFLAQLESSKLPRAKKA